MSVWKEAIYIKSYDVIRSCVIQNNSTTKLQKKVKKMTKTTTTNTTCTIQLHKKKHNQKQKNYENTLIEAIDAAFAQLGPNITKTIYFRMEKTFKIKKQELPHKIQEFTEAIEQIFGAGAKLIEIRIIKELHKRIPIFMHLPKKRKLDFIEYVTDLQAFLRVQVR